MRSALVSYKRPIERGPISVSVEYMITIRNEFVFRVLYECCTVQGPTQGEFQLAFLMMQRHRMECEVAALRNDSLLGTSTPLA